jgi:quinoprotein glucose dehydrogenase
VKINSELSFKVNLLFHFPGVQLASMVSKLSSLQGMMRDAFLPFSVSVLALCGGYAHAQNRSWADYGGEPDNSHFTELHQITKANVSKLKVAWTYPTQDNGGYMFNPVVSGRMMYVLARNNSLVALDATTGKEIWVHEKLAGIAARGINYWQSKDGSDKRLIFQIHNQLQEIDASTGKSILTFGTEGFIDLRVGLGRPLDQVFRVQSGNPGKVFENLIIMGSATGENYLAVPGDLRAFDVVTGKLVWQFHTIPHPGETGYDTFENKDAWRFVGGANTWGELSIDEKRGIAYFPTSSSKYELYGGDRLGENLFSDCILALDARTGKLKWYYQLVHHDIWDWDNVSAPQLVTVKHNGKDIDVVAQAGKTGFLYVFDRVSGKPLWPIDEKPVPQSDVPGEKTWPTQPFPSAPPAFSRQKMTVNDIDPYILTDAERAELKERIAKAKNGPLFTPPTIGDSMQVPGNRGGSNWGTTAANPQKGFVYVANYDAPAILSMTTVAPGVPVGVSATSTGNSGLELYSRNCAVCHGATRSGEIGPSLIDIDKRKTLAAIKSTIENGQGQMPSFSSLGDEKIAAIAGYISAPDLKRTPSELDAMMKYLNAPPAPDLVGGPIVGSGGAPAGKDAPGAKLSMIGPYGAMAGLPYPDGVKVPVERYYTGWNVWPTIIAPPWTSLVAYDLNKGTIKWKVPLGDDPALSPKGILNTGIRAEQRGIMPTSAGIVFVGTSDGKLRAFDEDNGKQIWNTTMPAGNRAIPAFFTIDGKEYLVVSATTKNSPSPDLPFNSTAPAPGDAGAPAYVVYTLP